MLEGMVCPYCKGYTELTDSSEVYSGQSFGPIWICRPCQAYVGCHKNTVEALGRVAKPQLRKAKKEAKEVFNRIWMERYMKRSQAYDWLSAQLQIDRELTHFGYFGLETCLRAKMICEEYLKVKI